MAVNGYVYSFSALNSDGGINEYHQTIFMDSLDCSGDRFYHFGNSASRI